VGGTDGYLRLLKRYPGVFYLTPGWAENWRTLMNKMEITRGIDGDDLATLRWMFEMAGYKLALKIQTGWGTRSASTPASTSSSTPSGSRERAAGERPHHPGMRGPVLRRGQVQTIIGALPDRTAPEAGPDASKKGISWTKHALSDDGNVVPGPGGESSLV
jgi:hypothetical protein